MYILDFSRSSWCGNGPVILQDLLADILKICRIRVTEKPAYQTTTTGAHRQKREQLEICWGRQGGLCAKSKYRQRDRYFCAARGVNRTRAVSLKIVSALSNRRSITRKHFDESNRKRGGVRSSNHIPSISPERKSRVSSVF